MQDLREGSFYAPQVVVNSEYKYPIKEKVPPLREFNINGNKVFAKNYKEAIKVAIYKGFIRDKKK